MGYYEIMAEPLPTSMEFGFEPPESGGLDALLESCERFKRTEGYLLWEIAMSEWMIRRNQAELDRQADSDGAYADYVRRNNPHAIAYEMRLIEEYTSKLEKMRRAS